ncbi:hypothetical protein DVH05_011829 [Phytophthora capsici]|nr:hypothetical protein DVH05_011829 [Phytophthora capsici]
MAMGSALHQTEQQRIALAISKLGGRAREWALTCGTSVDAAFPTLDQLKQQLVRAFAPTFARAQGLVIAGPCLTIYYDEGYKEKDVDAEVCLPIAKDAHVDEAGAATVSIVDRTLPSAPRAASLVHLGSYDTLNPSYMTLYEWIGKQGLRPNAPVREVYLRMNIEDTSEKSFVTEIQQPVE